MEKPSQSSEDAASAATDRIKDSAQQIWLAGLGAFAKMQQEGSKAFEALVKDGVGVQKRTQQAAEETLAQAQARMAGFASEFGTRAAGGWGKLENIFEDRVARALEKLGMPSAQEVAALQARVEALEAELRRQGGTAKPARAAARKTATRKAADTASKPSQRHKSAGG
ncbi:phasin family protein [Variovorax ureilyticus]|uniref:Phasin family protein n=1 Tax=Variovorax ureilyticus TaxID=1836198 RepID=A0ABU8VDH8_9BURK